MKSWWYLLIAVAMMNSYSASSSWQQPGCFKIGHTRKISVAGCVEFSITTNACRGYCVSWAIPSGLYANPTQPVTSVGQCCNMMESETVVAKVLCLEGLRSLTFKSAVSCQCYHCKKD